LILKYITEEKLNDAPVVVVRSVALPVWIKLGAKVVATPAALVKVTEGVNDPVLVPEVVETVILSLYLPAVAGGV